jgi:hypothetical protein
MHRGDRFCSPQASADIPRKPLLPPLVFFASRTTAITLTESRSNGTAGARGGPVAREQSIGICNWSVQEEKLG